MRRILALLAALVLAAPALAQSFPPTLPGNSVYGRLGGGVSGPGQAIPITTLRAQMLGTANVRGISPTDTGYGGVCNDSTASTANLTAFVLAAAASPVIFIPANCTYYMDSTTLPAALKLLYGQGGPTSSIIREPDGAAPSGLFYLAYSSTGIDIRDLSIKAQLVATKGKRALYLSSASNVFLFNVELASGIGLGIENSTNVTAERLWVSAWLGNAIRGGESGGDTNVRVVDMRVDTPTIDSSNAQGIYLQSPTGVQITGGTMTIPSSAMFGILFQGTPSGGTLINNPQQIRVSGVTMSTGGVEAIACEACVDLVIDRNIINGVSHTDNGIAAYANSDTTDATRSTKNVVISNNILNNIGAAAIVVNWGGKARNVTVIGNTIRNPATSATFIGTRGASSAISINGDSTVDIVGNTLFDEYSTSSVTSNTVASSGSKTWTVASALPYIAGDTLRIVDSAAPTTNYMQGTVSSYSGTTLVMTITSSAGSGTKTSWNIGRMLYFMSENTGSDSSQPTQNYFFSNKINSNGPALASTSYGLISSLSKASEGGTIKQSPGDAAGAGSRLQLSTDDTKFWDAYQTTAQLLRLQNQSAAGVSVDGSGNFLPDGYLEYTNEAAPGSPASGKVRAFADSTDLRFHDKNASGTIGTTVVSSTCTNQFVSALSTAGVLTCTTDTLASAQHANQGTTTTVLHGNASGNPSWAAVAISTDVSGLGTGVATFLATPSSANLASAITDETGSGLAVFATAPALTGNVTVTAPASGTSNTLTIAAGGNTASDVPTFRITSLAGTVVFNQFGDAANGNFRIKALGSVVFHAGNVGVSATNAFLTIATNGAITLGDGTGVAHLHSSGAAAPAPTSCGTNPSATGSDTSGTVTMGTGSPTGCVLTFAAAYNAAPNCTVAWNGALATMTWTTSTTALTLTQTATSSNKVSWTCFGN